MKIILAASLLLTLFFASISSAQRSAAVTAKNKRIALVIGNANYKSSPLSNPVNDAMDMSQLLTELGFQVVYKQDASQTEMKSAIREFGNNIVRGDVALFYYAGHGAQVNGENYLIPVDAVITKEEEIEYESVNAGLVLAQMANAANRLNIVILDACRNNPFARSSRSQTRGLAQMNAPAGTIIAYATDPGSVAADGMGQNGLYTEELLKAIRAPGLKIEDVFKQVRIAVRNKSQGKQTPWESSSLEGDFYFTQPGDNGPKVVKRVEAMDASPVEIKFWESIEDSNDPKDFEAYIRKYPSGNFLELAHNRVKSLEAAKSGVSPNLGAEAQRQMSVFQVKHSREFGSDHIGTLSISPQKIEWNENGEPNDPRDNFSISCYDISELTVNLLKKNMPQSSSDGDPTVSILSSVFNSSLKRTNREFITIHLKDKKLNQKGNKYYVFLEIDELSRPTIIEIGDIIRRACQGIKIRIHN